MTAVTVSTAFDTVDMAVRHFLLDIDEAYTWVCPMSTPLLAQVTNIEDSDAIVNYTLSGRTFTFHESSGSGVKVAVTVYGRV